MHKAACCVLVPAKAVPSLTLCSSAGQLLLVAASRTPVRLTIPTWGHAGSVRQGTCGTASSSLTACMSLLGLAGQLHAFLLQVVANPVHLGSSCATPALTHRSSP